MGFVKKGVFSFYRVHGEIFDVISASILSSGENLRVYCYCWIPEVDPGYDLKLFPKYSSIMVGGSIGDSAGFYFREKLWSVRTPDMIDVALKEVLAVLQGVALPWIERVVDRRTFVNKVDVNIVVREDWPARKELLLNGNSV